MTEQSTEANARVGQRLLRDEPDAFDALRDLAAGHHQVDPGAIEKDYWATEVLRSATAPIDGVEQFVFKGGTLVGPTHPGRMADSLTAQRLAGTRRWSALYVRATRG